MCVSVGRASCVFDTGVDSFPGVKAAAEEAVATEEEEAVAKEEAEEEAVAKVEAEEEAARSCVRSCGEEG